MKTIIYLLLFTIADSKIINLNTNQSILTTYQYNSSFCNTIPYLSETQTVESCLYQNMSICYNKNNQSFFTNCQNIYTNYSYEESNIKIIITILVIFLFFILYKSFFETCIDECFYSIYELITDQCHSKSENVYNSLDKGK